MLAQQHQRGGPAVALTLDAPHGVAVERRAAEECVRLVLGAAQIRDVDARDLASRAEPGELLRRVGAREHDDVDAFRELLEPCGEGCALVGGRARLLEVVEHDQRAVRERGEQVAAEAPGEAREILLRLGGEHRQRAAPLAEQRLRRLAHVVHERGGVAVADVHLVPQVRQLPRLGVARDQRRLARSRGGGDPDDRPLARGVEALEEPRPRQRVVEPGSRQFRERGGACGHGRGLRQWADRTPSTARTCAPAAASRRIRLARDCATGETAADPGPSSRVEVAAKSHDRDCCYRRPPVESGCATTYG